MIPYIKQILPYLQIGISFFLMGCILLQQKGGGLSGAFGGSGEGNVYRSKRGLEKLLFRASIFFSFLFILSAFLNLIL